MYEYTTKPRSLMLHRFMVILTILLNAAQLPNSVRATDDVANISPCELESIINQLVDPSPEYQLHASALRNQLKNILRERQLAAGEEQSLNNDYDYPEEDKRSVASLASLGLLRGGGGGGGGSGGGGYGKRGIATLAKNGQLPTKEPEDSAEVDSFSAAKRYLAALARSGGLMSPGKRNIGALARDYQLPPSGKRSLEALARLGLLNTNLESKRNVASVARYNSNRMSAGGSGSTAASSTLAAEKRNLAALRGSAVHGWPQKRRDNEEDDFLMDYVDLKPGYWLYPGSYADLDWDDSLHESQKRFLGRILPPTRATSSTRRSRL